MQLRPEFSLPALMALTLGLSGLPGSPVAAQEAPTVNTVVATVNGTDITLGHMAILRAGLPDQYQQLPPGVLYEGLLDQLINQTLLVQQAGDMPDRVKMLLDNNSRQVIANEVLGMLLDSEVTVEMVQAAYDAEFADFTPAQEYNASHILVESEDEAAGLTERARAGEDFAGLAKEHSTGPSGPNGGQLGWFGQGQMVQPFEAAVMAMAPGDISDPVQTQFGWHVIRLNEARDLPAPTLEEVEGDLRANLEREQAEAIVARMMEASEVSIVEGIDPAAIMDPMIFEK